MIYQGELTERDKKLLRVLLKEQKKVAFRKSEWRRRRDSAKHFWPGIDDSSLMAR